MEVSKYNIKFRLHPLIYTCLESDLAQDIAINDLVVHPVNSRKQDMVYRLALALLRVCTCGILLGGFRIV